MLVKADFSKENQILYQSSGSQQGKSGAPTTFGTTTLTEELYLKTSFHVKMDTSSTTNAILVIIINGEVYESYRGDKYGADFNVDLGLYPAGTVIYYSITSGTSSYYGYASNVFLYGSFYKSKTRRIGITPCSVKSLGNLADGFIYGVDSNGDYQGGVIVGESESVRTGEITLGNAVGYIKVLYNGEYIMIPYYGE